MKDTLTPVQKRSLLPIIIKGCGSWHHSYFTFLPTHWTYFSPGCTRTESNFSEGLFSCLSVPSNHLSFSSQMTPKNSFKVVVYGFFMIRNLLKNRSWTGGEWRLSRMNFLGGVTWEVGLSSEEYEWTVRTKLDKNKQTKTVSKKGNVYI